LPCDCPKCVAKRAGHAPTRKRDPRQKLVTFTPSGQGGVLCVNSPGPFNDIFRDTETFSTDQRTMLVGMFMCIDLLSDGGLLQHLNSVLSASIAATAAALKLSICNSYTEIHKVLTEIETNSLNWQKNAIENMADGTHYQTTSEVAETLRNGFFPGFSGKVPEAN
jgi:hypothetical protein